MPKKVEKVELIPSELVGDYIEAVVKAIGEVMRPLTEEEQEIELIKKYKNLETWWHWHDGWFNCKAGPGKIYVIGRRGKDKLVLVGGSVVNIMSPKRGFPWAYYKTREEVIWARDMKFKDDIRRLEEDLEYERKRYSEFKERFDNEEA